MVFNDDEHTFLAVTRRNIVSCWVDTYQERDLVSGIFFTRMKDAGDPVFRILILMQGDDNRHYLGYSHADDRDCDYLMLLEKLKG